MTPVSRFAEGFVEAGWLVVAVLVAALLNPFSDQVFEPDKAALLRVLVVLMVAAWVVCRLDGYVSAPRSGSDGGGAGHKVKDALRTLSEQPIATLALVLLLTYLASTATSVSPRLSWWGSYQRAEGTYTFLAYLGLFFMVLSSLRRADQLQRLISVLLFTSFPIALYAILQHYGMSLLQFSAGGVEARVISTLGNAIFLAAYLAMVVPLTLWRILQSIREWRRLPVRAVLGTLLYGGLCLLQLGAIVFTQSRGPILGLVVELFVFVLLIALLRRQRRWALAGLLATGVIIALLLALNIPGPLGDSLRRLPYVARFGELAGAGAQTVQARALAWDTVLNAVRAEPGRIVVGYGPETMKPVLTRFMPAELWVLQGGGQYGTFDRAHNAVLDALYASGIVGVVVYLFLYGVIFCQVLRWLGLIRTSRQGRILVGLLIGGAVLGLLVPWLWGSDLALAAIGVPAGMIGGMVAYLLCQVVRSPVDTSTAGETDRLLLAALLAAIVGHFVETQTGIEIVVTQTYFWLFTALLILVGTGRIREAEPARRPISPRAGRGRPRHGRRNRRMADGADLGSLAQDAGSIAAMGLVVAVLLGALSYAFVHGFNAPGARRPAQVLVSITWLFGGLLVLLERYRSAADTDLFSSDALAYGMTSLIWVLPFALYHRLNATALDRLNVAYLVFVIWMILTVVGIAVALQWGHRSARSGPRSDQTALYALIVLLALVLAWRVDVTRIQADIHEKVGKTALGAGLWDQAVPNLQQAVDLQPQQDQYYVYLAGAYVEQARLLSEPATKDAQMERARQILEQAQALAPRDSDEPRQLGLIYRVWADWAQNDITRRQRLQTSLRYYLAAVDLNPQNPDLRLDLAGAYFVLGMNEEAFTQYQHAVAIGSPNHLGRAYAGVGDIYLLRGQLEQAVAAYGQAMQAGRDHQEVLDTRVRAVARQPNNIQVRLSLALVYVAAKRQGDALSELKAALDLASSAAEQAEVERLIEIVQK
ncbi:MAG: O-antigen ligase family protein [Anaerolineae bacterium]